MPAVAPITSVMIDALLRNPVGDDLQLETVTLVSKSTTVVSLQGWILRDRSGLHWDLTGTILAGRSRTLRRNGQGMSLNNAGDEITLVDATQQQRDQFTCTSSVEGVVIRRP